MWNEKEEKWYFSIIDVVSILTNQPTHQGARNYWKVLKSRLLKEGNETVTNCNRKEIQHGKSMTVQKKKLLSDYEIKHLKEKGLIEGRKPNFHISAGVAEKTGQKEDYIKNMAFKDQHYKDLILEFIDKYKFVTKEGIDKLIMDILPAVLDKNQKENKVRNIVYAMSKKDKTIINKGTIRYPKWERN